MSDTEPKRSSRFSLWREKWGPFAIAIIGLGLILYFRIEVAAQFGEGGGSLTNLYTAIFDWAAIQTGFLFGVYGFMISKSEGFIKELQGSITLERFINYIKRASRIGFILTFISMPLIVWNPNITTEPVWVFVVVALWFCLFVWAFLAFIRAAYIFGIIVQIRDKSEVRG